MSAATPEADLSSRGNRSATVLLNRVGLFAMSVFVIASCMSGANRVNNPPSETSAFEWVATLEHAQSPNDRRFERLVATIVENSRLQLGQQLVVSPASCWEGLQEALGLPDGSYVVAVIGQSHQEVTELVELAGYAKEPSRRLSMCRD